MVQREKFDGDIEVSWHRPLHVDLTLQVLRVQDKTIFTNRRRGGGLFNLLALVITKRPHRGECEAASRRHKMSSRFSFRPQLSHLYYMYGSSVN